MSFNMQVLRTVLLLLLSAICVTCSAQTETKIRKKDRKRDVLMETTLGSLVIRLSDRTPLHRDNFIRLVKKHYYDSVLFHRVISGFMIQAGDPNSRRALPHQPLGNGGPGYTLPAEFVPELFHKKGALAAARMGDQVNPEKASSGSQFYLVQGRTYSNAGLDSMETYLFPGRKIDPAYRDQYKSVGGVPHLDQQYTVFGEIILGLDVLDSIAAVPVSKGPDRDRPLTDVRIISTKLVRQKK
jgi:peptidyl-prolyl cis-trans isomerase B (cyclophilin B)